MKDRSMVFDIPEIEMELLEILEPLGAPFGAKGIAEAPIIPTAPAIRDQEGHPLSN